MNDLGTPININIFNCNVVYAIPSVSLYYLEVSSPSVSNRDTKCPSLTSKLPVRKSETRKLEMTSRRFRRRKDPGEFLISSFDNI